MVYRSRRYLFHTILIQEKNFTRFVFLIIQQPHITGFVRDVYFEAGGDAFSNLGRQPSTIVRVFALVIAPRLPNVLRLTVKDVPFTQDVVEMLDPSFPQLCALSLFDCWFTCHGNLETLVRNHPRVHTLRCGRLCSLHGADSPAADQTRTPLQMRALKVTEAYAPTPLTLMPWLVNYVQPEKFTYTLYRLSQVAKLNQTIAGYASMRHLHIIFYHWRKGDTDAVIESPQVMELTPHYPPSLTTLTLDAKLHSLLLVVHLLARLDPHSFTRLQTVNIIAHVRADEIENIEYEAWAGMDQTLSVLLSLGAVNFTNSCQDPSHVEEGSAAIMARLRVLSVRNMLSFAAEKPRDTPPYTMSSRTGTPNNVPSNTLLLRRQLMELTKHPVEGFSAGLVDENNLYEWEVMIIGPPDTIYEGGFFKARLSFPEDFPLNPPKMRFITPMWHPNIYPDGLVCISILHPPGEDQYGYEDSGERWLPVHTVESILLSVISLLSSDKPNLDSPANVDAAKEIRTDFEGYKKKVRRLVRRSAEEAFD
ncbi:hypothetical protein ACG7TL_007611 [Trametes sanguinea]